MTFDTIIRQAAILRDHARAEMADDELVMNEATFDVLTENFRKDGEDRSAINLNLFGLPIVVEEHLPDGVVHRRRRRSEEEQ